MPLSPPPRGPAGCVFPGVRRPPRPARYPEPEQGPHRGPPHDRRGRP